MTRRRMNRSQWRTDGLGVRARRASASGQTSEPSGGRALSALKTQPRCPRAVRAVAPRHLSQLKAMTYWGRCCRFVGQLRVLINIVSQEALSKYFKRAGRKCLEGMSPFYEWSNQTRTWNIGRAEITGRQTRQEPNPGISVFSKIKQPNHEIRHMPRHSLQLFDLVLDSWLALH
jgi:hypothetical protein